MKKIYFLILGVIISFSRLPMAHAEIVIVDPPTTINAAEISTTGIVNITFDGTYVDDDGVDKNKASIQIGGSNKPDETINLDGSLYFTNNGIIETDGVGVQLGSANKGNSPKTDRISGEFGVVNNGIIYAGDDALRIKFNGANAEFSTAAPVDIFEASDAAKDCNTLNGTYSNGICSFQAPAPDQISFTQADCTASSVGGVTGIKSGNSCLYEKVVQVNASCESGLTYSSKKVGQITTAKCSATKDLITGQGTVSASECGTNGGTVDGASCVYIAPPVTTYNFYTAENCTSDGGVSKAGKCDFSEKITKNAVLGIARVDNYGLISGGNNNGNGGAAISIAKGVEAIIHNHEGAVIHGGIDTSDNSNGNKARNQESLVSMINEGIWSLRPGDRYNDLFDYTQRSTGILEFGVEGSNALDNSMDSNNIVRQGIAQISGRNDIVMENNYLSVFLYKDTLTEGDPEFAKLTDGDILKDVIKSVGANATFTVKGLELNANTDFFVFDNSLAYRFIAEPYARGESGNAWVDMRVEETGFTTFNQVAQNANLTGSTGIASYLDSQYNTGGRDNTGMLDSIYNRSAAGDLGYLMFQLTSLPTEREVANALESLSPGVAAGAVAEVSAMSVRNGLNVLRSRVEAVSLSTEYTGSSSGDSVDVTKSHWFQPFGSWADQRNGSGITGYNADTYGVAFGGDAQIKDDLLLGGAFLYSRSAIDTTGNADQNATLKSYNLALYGKYDFDEDTHLNFQAGFGIQDNETARTINVLTLSTLATADYDGETYFISGSLARNFAFNVDTVFTPSVNIEYIHTKTDGYTEKNAGDIGLRVGSNTAEDLLLSVSGKLTKAITNSAQLFVMGTAGQDLINHDESVTASFVGSTIGGNFRTTGVDREGWLLRGGVGLNFIHSADWQGLVRYDVEARDKMRNQSFVFTVKRNF